MANVARRQGPTSTEQLARRYLVEDGLADDLRGAVAVAKAHPEVARRIYELINSLPGKSEAEQREIVQAVQALIASTQSQPLSAMDR